MRIHLVAIVGIAAACADPTPPPDHLTGAWRLATICLYDREGPPCESVSAAPAPELTFLAGARYARRNPDETGTYTLERRSTNNGGDELLIRFDDGVPALLHVAADSLIVNWAYVDGPELRYVAIGR